MLYIDNLLLLSLLKKINEVKEALARINEVKDVSLATSSADCNICCNDRTSIRSPPSPIASPHRVTNVDKIPS